MEQHATYARSNVSRRERVPHGLRTVRSFLLSAPSASWRIRLMELAFMCATQLRPLQQCCVVTSSGAIADVCATAASASAPARLQLFPYKNLKQTTRPMDLTQYPIASCVVLNSWAHYTAA